MQNICCILMVAEEAELIVFQLLFFMSYLSIKDHFDSFLRRCHPICQVEYEGFSAISGPFMGLENCSLLKTDA